MMSDSTVYYYPFEHSNQYVDISKNIIAQAGYSVKKFNGLFNPINILNRKNNIVVLNWFEDRPYQKKFSFLRSFFEFVIILFLLLIIKLFVHRIIWVRHNFKPHSRINRPFTHKINCWLLAHLAEHTVSLEPVSNFASTVVPHPLYMDDQLLSNSIKNMAARASKHDEIDYLFFGAVKRYKRLEELLTFWPQGLKLDVVGFCEDNRYRCELEDIIRNRELDVNWKNEYVSDECLDNILFKTKFAFMPHDDGAMISSGTFYQAINHGINIISFDSDFARNKMSIHEYVHIVDSNRLAEELSNIQPVERSEVIKDALTYYGREAIKNAWRACLNPKP